jgi:hypothetical protein
MEDAMSKLTIDALPTAAKNRLIALDSQRLEADDGQRAAQMRLSSFPHSADPAVVEQMNLVRDKWQQRSESLSQLCNRIRFWVGSQNTAAVFEMAPAVKAELPDGLTICETIEETRNQIDALHQNLDVVRMAPEPKAALKEKAAQFVRELAARGRPKVSAGPGGITVAFTDPRAGTTMASRDDVAAIAAWLHESAMVSALEREINLLPEGVAPLPTEERERRISQLAADLEHLERIEEHLVQAAASDGQDVLRRPDALPAAVLGVSIAAARATVAA